MVPTSGERVKKWMFRVFTWFVVLALLGGSGYATYKVSIELSLQLAEKVRVWCDVLFSVSQQGVMLNRYY